MCRMWRIQTFLLDGANQPPRGQRADHGEPDVPQRARKRVPPLGRAGTREKTLKLKTSVFLLIEKDEDGSVLGRH